MTDSLFEITVKGELLGQEWLNVFFYYASPTGLNTVDALDAATAFASGISTVWSNCVSNNTQFHTVTARDIYDPANTGSMAWPVTNGTISLLETLMSFLTLSFQFPTTTGNIKSGGKRLAGANEAIYTDGTLSPFPTFLSSLLDFMLLMTEVFSVLDSSDLPVDLIPIVVKRIRSGSPGAYEYRLPENLLETDAYQIETVEFNGVSTQNTRKPPVLTTPFGA